MYERYLILYDIRHATRLRHIAQIAEDYGLRMQKSIFEADLTPSELQKMKIRMSNIILPEEDGIKIFRLCQSCESKRTGTGKQCPELPDSPWHIF